MDTKLIDCSNIKSLNYKKINYKSAENAQWTNLVDIDVNIGDTINVENAIINLKGVGSGIVEITGTNAEESKLADSKFMLKTIPYVCDIGANTVALPICGTTNNLAYPLDYTLDGGTRKYPSLNFDPIGVKFQFMKVNINVPVGRQGSFNYNEPMCDHNSFSFSFWNRTDSVTGINPEDKLISPLKSNLKTYFTEKAHIGNFEFNSGMKYTIIQKDYQGPFMSSPGNFHSGEDDFYPEYLEVKIDLGGAQFEQPSTICNVINNQLNATDVYGDSEINQTTLGKYLTINKLPTVTGPLLKNKWVNGMANATDDGERTDNKKLWGNFAVRNYSEWLSCHYLMRLDLVNNGEFNVNDDIPYKTFFPSFMIPSGKMSVNDPFNDSINVTRSYYPRISKTITISHNNINDKYTDYYRQEELETTIGNFYYSTIGKYFLICTNVAYTDANMKRFQKAFSNNEIYDGSFLAGERQDTDIDNWRVHLDMGSSQQGNSTGSSDDIDDYFAYSQGYVKQDENVPVGQPVTGYAFSVPALPWGDIIPEIDNAYSTPRSDMPQAGVATFQVQADETVNSNISVYSTNITSGIPLFKNNKNKDCRIGVSSRYNKNWKSLYRTDNLPNGVLDITKISHYGFGSYHTDRHPVTHNNDDSLSQKYNIGVYPVDMPFDYEADEDNNVHTVCAFMLYRDAATWNQATTSFDISPDFALPCMHQAQQLVSCSFLDHPAVWLVNGRRWDESDDLFISAINPPVNVTEWGGLAREENINIMSIGCNNPTIEFDNSLSKCTISNLHNVKKLGLDDMAKTDGDDNTQPYTYTIANMGNEVIKINNANIKYGLIWNIYTSCAAENGHVPYSPDEITQYLGDGDKNNISWGLVYATSGIFIDSFYGEGINENNTTSDQMVLYTPDNWEGCLLNKLGFDYYDLFSKHGSTENIYDYSRVHDPQPSNYTKLLKPITTNPIIDISQATSLAVSDFTAGLSNNLLSPCNAEYGALPMYGNSIGTLAQINLVGTNSEKLIASQLPIKLASPYYLIYSDICSPNYIQNQNELPVVGIILKNYISGDNIYSFTSPPINIQINRKITSINIVIRDNAGKIVLLDNNSSIIFKLVKNTFNAIIDK